MVATSKPAAPKTLVSKVKIYKAAELDLLGLSDRSKIQLGKTPREFQTRFFSNVMQGRDVILDVGTGSGKSLCFDLPFLCNKEDIVLVVSPLSALMLEQVRVLSWRKSIPLIYYRQRHLPSLPCNMQGDTYSRRKTCSLQGVC